MVDGRCGIEGGSESSSDRFQTIKLDYGQGGGSYDVFQQNILYKAEGELNAKRLRTVK